MGQPESAQQRTGCQRRLALRALGADGVWALAPGRPCAAPVAAGSLPRATVSRSAPKAGALRARAPTCAPRVITAHVVSWGEWGCRRSRVLRADSRGSVQGVLRAPAEGEGGVAHREDLAATASATLERSTGTVAHGKRAAHERRRRRSKVSRRRRAGHAPPARLGGACACRARSNGRRRPCGGWWWCAHQLRITSGRLPPIGGSISTTR